MVVGGITAGYLVLHPGILLLDGHIQDGEDTPTDFSKLAEADKAELAKMRMG